MGHGEIHKDKTRVSLILPKTLKDYLQSLAKTDDRSLNYIIEKILSEYMAAHKLSQSIKEYEELSEPIKESTAQLAQK